MPGDLEVSGIRPSKRSNERSVSLRISKAADAVKAVQNSIATAPPPSDWRLNQQIQPKGINMPKNGLTQRKTTSSGPAPALGDHERWIDDRQNQIGGHARADRTAQARLPGSKRQTQTREERPIGQYECRAEHTIKKCGHRISMRERRGDRDHTGQNRKLRNRTKRAPPLSENDGPGRQRCAQEDVKVAMRSRLGQDRRRAPQRPARARWKRISRSCLARCPSCRR